MADKKILIKQADYISNAIFGIAFIFFIQNIENDLMAKKREKKKNVPYKGLLKKDIEKAELVNPAFWAMGGIYIDGEPFSIQNYNFQKELYEAAYEESITIQKGSQLGFSTWAIVTTLWYLRNNLFKGNGLYVMPTQKKAGDFSQARVDKMIDESPEFSDGDLKIDNVTLKQFKNRDNLNRERLRTLYFRGGQDSKQVTELPANWQVFDEIDEFKDKSVIKLAKKRSGGSAIRFYKHISTPTYIDVGINAMYKRTTMEEWQVRCKNRKCKKWQTLDFFKNTDHEKPEKEVFCRFCEKSIDRLSEGRYHALKPKNKSRGFYISRLYSPTTDIKELIDEYKKLRGESERQIFYNMELGIPYEPKGGRLMIEEIKEAIDEDVSIHDRKSKEQSHFIGIDVGAVLNYIIIRDDEVVVDYGEVESFEEMHEIINEWGAYFVIDAMPEQRKSIELCKANMGMGKVCFYKENENTKEMEDGEYEQITKNRTMTLDRAFDKVRKGDIKLPIEVGEDQEFLDQMNNQVRTKTKKEIKGETVIRVTYEDHGKPDHYGHALNYAVICLLSFDAPSVRRM